LYHFVAFCHLYALYELRRCSSLIRNYFAAHTVSITDSWCAVTVNINIGEYCQWCRLNYLLCLTQTVSTISRLEEEYVLLTLVTFILVVASPTYHYKCSHIIMHNNIVQLFFIFAILLLLYAVTQKLKCFLSHTVIESHQT